MASEKGFGFLFLNGWIQICTLYQALYTQEYHGSDKLVNYAQTVYVNIFFSGGVWYTHHPSIYACVFHLFKVLFIKLYVMDGVDNRDALGKSH